MPCAYQWNSDWSKLCIPYCTEPCAIRSGMDSDLVRSRMFSCTAAVLISTSDAGTRPLPSLRGTSRSDTIACSAVERDRKSTRLNSSHDQISYAVFCLKKKKKNEVYNEKRHARHLSNGNEVHTRHLELEREVEVQDADRERDEARYTHETDCLHANES